MKRPTDRVLIALIGSGSQEWLSGRSAYPPVRVMDMQSELQHRAELICPGLTPTPERELASLLARTAAWAPGGTDQIHVITGLTTVTLPEFVREGAQVIACGSVNTALVSPDLYWSYLSDPNRYWLITRARELIRDGHAQMDLWERGV